MCNAAISTRWNGMRRAEERKKKLNFQLIIDSPLCRSWCTSDLIYYANDANTETNGLRKCCQRKRIFQNASTLQLVASFPHHHIHTHTFCTHKTTEEEQKTNQICNACEMKCACLPLLKYSVLFRWSVSCVICWVCRPFNSGIFTFCLLIWCESFSIDSRTPYVWTFAATKAA